MFTAGYNNYEVAEYLLENGADVNAQDKGYNIIKLNFRVKVE